ncbi:MAG TPA: hypothetical protein PKK95_08545, partial [Vicinamibacterales bacterium]|nr:hypothetical protein [Vicinamibacterales bacterium]
MGRAPSAARARRLGSLAVAAFLAAWTGGCASAPPEVRTPSAPSPLRVTLPAAEGSVRFAVIGDGGTGKRHQVEVAGRRHRLARRAPQVAAGGAVRMVLRPERIALVPPAAD